MASYTQNYQLHQWEAEDDFLRTDFNEDFAKIDEAIAEKTEIVTGSYVGTGAFGGGEDQYCTKISFEGTPKFIIVGGADSYLLFLLPGMSCGLRLTSMSFHQRLCPRHMAGWLCPVVFRLRCVSVKPGKSELSIPDLLLKGVKTGPPLRVALKRYLGRSVFCGQVKFQATTSQIAAMVLVVLGTIAT